MAEIYITITGFKNYFGLKPFSIGSKILCLKEPDNQFDSEAIVAVVAPIGTVGYVANSPITIANVTMSAGRIYDKIGKSFWAEVMFTTCSKIICKVLDEVHKEEYIKIEITDLNTVFKM